MKERIRERASLTCSIGVAPTKMLYSHLLSVPYMTADCRIDLATQDIHVVQHLFDVRTLGRTNFRGNSEFA